MVPDHRSTGFSTRMCPPEEAPASPAGMALVVADAAGRQIPYLTRDIDEGEEDWAGTALAAVEKDMAAYGSLPQSPTSLPLVMLISSSENDLRSGRTTDDVGEEEAGLLFASSLPATWSIRRCPCTSATRRLRACRHGYRRRSSSASIATARRHAARSCAMSRRCAKPDRWRCTRPKGASHFTAPSYIVGPRPPPSSCSMRSWQAMQV
jgi:hypothetical protein